MYSRLHLEVFLLLNFSLGNHKCCLYFFLFFFGKHLLWVTAAKHFLQTSIFNQIFQSKNSVYIVSKATEVLLNTDFIRHFLFIGVKIMVINTECIHISDDFFHDFGITVSKATEVLLNTDFGGHFFLFIGHKQWM